MQAILLTTDDERKAQDELSLERFRADAERLTEEFFARLEEQERELRETRREICEYAI